MHFPRTRKNLNVERVHTRFCKPILRVFNSTPNFMIYTELRRLPLFIFRNSIHKIFQTPKNFFRNLAKTIWYFCPEKRRFLWMFFLMLHKRVFVRVSCPNKRILQLLGNNFVLCGPDRHILTLKTFIKSKPVG